MRSLVFHSRDNVSLVEKPRPESADGEALVRVEVSAICGSELEASPGSNPGHESAGIVEQIPEGTSFNVGDRVGVSAVTGCGVCPECLRGVQLFCERTPRIHTEMHADYVTVPVSALRAMPDGTPASHAVLISGDTLGVPVRAQNRLPTKHHDRVLIIGLGPVGLGHTLVRSHSGAEVFAIEPSRARRELALALGATQVFDLGEQIDFKANLVIECTGIPACIKQALACCESGGTVLQSGECETHIEVSPSEDFIRREITYTGGWYYADEDFPEMVRLYKAGLPVDTMLTDELPASEVAEAYRRFVSKESGKVVIRWS
jgi:L-iditol 2-dehydrogenase